MLCMGFNVEFLLEGCIFYLALFTHKLYGRKTIWLHPGKDLYIQFSWMGEWMHEDSWDELCQYLSLSLSGHLTTQWCRWWYKTDIHPTQLEYYPTVCDRIYHQPSNSLPCWHHRLTTGTGSGWGGGGVHHPGLLFIANHDRTHRNRIQQMNQCVEIL